MTLAIVAGVLTIVTQMRVRGEMGEEMCFEASPMESCFIWFRTLPEPRKHLRATFGDSLEWRIVALVLRRI